MRSLLMTTSTKLASISLFEDKEMLANINVNVKKTHSTWIINQIEDILNWTSTKISDIEMVVVSIGPGSFTGVRIALATIKGMFANQKIDIYTVNELDALGFQGCQIYKKDVVAIINSNKEKIYYGFYSNGNRVGELKVSKLRDMLEIYYDKDICFIGDGAIAYREKIQEYGFNIDISNMFLRINSVIFFDMYEKGMLEKADLFNLVPDYLEKSQAEKEKDGN